MLESNRLNRFPIQTLNLAVKTLVAVLAIFLLVETWRVASGAWGPTLFPPLREILFSNHLVTAALGTYCAYLFLPGGAREKWVVTAVGLVGEFGLFRYRLPERGFLGSLVLIGFALGLCGLVALLLRLLRDKQNRARLIGYTALASLTPVLLLAAGFFHTWNTILNPMVYDVYSYAVDSVWGFSPPFVVNRLCHEFFLLLGLPAYIVYWELALWMVLSVLAGLWYPRHRGYHEGFAALLLIGVVGAMLYGIFPSTGTDDLFGAKFRDTATYFDYHPSPSEFETAATGGAP